MASDEKPLVTFALFAYNQEKYIREVVEAALSQNYDRLEIVLSDDCSSDKTFEIKQTLVADYQGAHAVTLRRNNRNLGLAEHVNQMLAQASGKIVLLAAGDDISVPERTAISVALVDKYPSASAVLLSASVIDKNGMHCGEKNPVRRGVDQVQMLETLFAPAADVLVWMVLRVFGRVLSWPMAFIQLSLGAGRWFMVTEAFFVAIQVAMATWLVPRYGVIGAAYAFAICCVLYTTGMTWVGHRLIGLHWSVAALRMMLASSVLMGLALAANRLLPDSLATGVGGVLALVGGVWSLRGLAIRLGAAHRLVHWMRRVPGMRLMIGV